MYERILVAIDVSEKSGWQAPLAAAAEHARTFASQKLTVLSVIREIDALVYAQMRSFSYEIIVRDMESRLAAWVREIAASDLAPEILVRHGESIYEVILDTARETKAELIVVGAHRPAMKDYLLGTNAGRVVRHAHCSVLVARDLS